MFAETSNQSCLVRFKTIERNGSRTNIIFAEWTCQVSKLFSVCSTFCCWWRPIGIFIFHIFIFDSSEFEDIAISTLNLLDKKDNTPNNNIVADILLQPNHFNDTNRKTNTLRLAFEYDCKRFLSQPPVQNLLDRIWKYGLNEKKVDLPPNLFFILL